VISILTPKQKKGEKGGREVAVSYGNKRRRRKGTDDPSQKN